MGTPGRTCDPAGVKPEGNGVATNLVPMPAAAVGLHRLGQPPRAAEVAAAALRLGSLSSRVIVSTQDDESTPSRSNIESTPASKWALPSQTIRLVNGLHDNRTEIL
jgi:hypothetical protein